jgi:hypothetical protein
MQTTTTAQKESSNTSELWLGATTTRQYETIEEVNNNWGIDKEENGEKDGENGDNNSNSNKNAIAVNSTCHWESGMCVVCTGIYGKRAPLSIECD